MIINLLLDILFGILNWLLDFLPEYEIEALCNNTLQIFGYGIYILGEGFFNIFINIFLTEITLTITFNLARFGVNVTRGSGG